MRPLAAIALMLLAMVASGAAQAQKRSQAQATQAPTAAQRCLTVTPDAPDSQPVYPFEPFKRGKPGKVQVELRFTQPDGAPAVQILSSEGGDEFETAVREHARRLRVPCLTPAEGTATARFEFVFQPEAARPAMVPQQDSQAAKCAASIDCVKHVSGDSLPEYPRRALSQEQQGRVLVTLRFESADSPPVAKVYARHSAELLGRGIKTWVEGLRMACYPGEPVEFTMTYVFLLEGDAYGFVPGLSFRQLLAVLPAEQRSRMPADTTTMGCPFNVRFTSRQPELPNDVAQLDNWRAERQPFMDWLREVTLDGPTRLRDALFGDTTRFQVPCFKIQSTAQANPSTNKE